MEFNEGDCHAEPRKVGYDCRRTKQCTYSVLIDGFDQGLLDP